MPGSWRWFCVFACFALLAGPAWAEKRVALVIGNSAYSSMAALKNPTNDAQDIAAALETLGFAVTEESDLDFRGMREAVADFASASADAEISILYYAGHGIEVEGRNFLIPVDADLERLEDIPVQTVDFQGILDELAVGDGVRIVFLDACRNNPVPSLQLAGGLEAPALPRGDFLVAYATLPSNVAYDGGGRNSPFAGAVLQHLTERGRDVSALLAAVRNDVKLNTGAKQLPQEWSTLSRQVYLAPGKPDAFPPETLLFQLAANGPDADLLKLYLDRYPNGPHVENVRSLVESAEASTEAPQSDTRQVEDLLWALASNERNGPLVELYLARYSDGVHAEEARKLLPALTTDDNISADALCLQLATHPNDATSTSPGVPGAVLHEHRDQAIAACREAVSEFPENPHFETLLARAMAAGVAGAEIPAEAVQLYERAAERGDARAMVSLGLLKQTGNGVLKDPAGAVELYEWAANLHFPDGGVQLGYVLATGTGTDKDMQRAVEVYKQATLDGSAKATFNLGVLYLDKALGLGTDVEALDLFLRAAEQGERSGYTAAAKILDGGYDVPRDHEAAAQYLLMGVSTDPGDAFEELTEKAKTWSPETIRAVQLRLQEAGYYLGSIDGESGPKFGAALNQWRLLGPPSRS